MKLFIPLVLAILSVVGVSKAVRDHELPPDLMSGPGALVEAVAELETRVEVYRENNERLRSALTEQLTRHDSLANELMLARKQLQDRGVEGMDGPPIYWLSTSTDKRHNRGCRWYEKTQGRHCSQNEGLPCNSCGG